MKPGDRARVTRALEVVLATGRSILDWHGDNKPASVELARAAKVFLMPDRDELVRRIDARFDAMMAAGALDEVRALAARQLDANLPAMKAHGVPWLIRYINGEIALAEAVEHAKLRNPPIHQAAGDLVPQSAAGFRLGRAARRARRGRSAAAGARRRLAGWPRSRHCERSEAIQPSLQNWIASSLRSSQ